MSKTTVLAGGFGLVGLSAPSVAVWFLVQDLTDGNPYPPDAEPTVLIEWRLPEAVRHDWVDGIFRFTMRSSYMDWTLTSHWQEPRARDEDGRTILRMRAIIRWRVNDRIFQLWRAPNHGDRITADLGSPRDPKPTAEYGPGHEVDSAPGNAFRTRFMIE